MKQCDHCSAWDPETDMSTIEPGFGLCRRVVEDPIGHSDRRKLHVYITETPCVINYLITRADFHCSLFSSAFP